MAIPVHVDVDPGSDDAVMMALAFASPDIEVVGTSTVGGNSTVANTTRNALRIHEHFDRADVPVARGASMPLEGEYETVEWIHGPEGMRGDLPDPETEPINVHGAQFIVEQAEKYGSDLVIAAVGPMTNLAMALLLEPELPDLVSDIYLMGGAAMTNGNATPMAEANIRNDPVAARRVMYSGRPRMVGLDATHEATIPLDWIDEFRSQPAPKGTIGDWFDYPEEVRGFGGTQDPAIHDAAVIAHLIDETLLEFEPYHVDVDTSHGPSRGATVCDRYGVTGNEANVDVAVSADTDTFRRVLADAFDQL